MGSHVRYKGPALLTKIHGQRLKLARPDRTPTVRAALMYAWRCSLKDKAACVGQQRGKHLIPILRRSNFVSTASIVRCHFVDQLPLRPADLFHRPNLQKLAS